jgi:hypothetical protein
MKTIRFIGTLFATILIVSCGNGKSGNVKQIVVALSPAVTTMDQGATKQFAATVTGNANTAVVWSVSEGIGGGSIDAHGRYTAPSAAGVFHVTATSVVDTSKKATAQVSVNSVAISVSPTVGDLEPGSTQQFTATVTGSVNHNVVWSLNEGAGGSITNDGLYTAPAGTGMFHIVASSVADSTRSVSVVITVAKLSVLISPGALEITPGRTRSLSASVSGCMDDRVAWSVQEGGSGGAISDNGLYTAPTELGEYHVIATSIAHPGVSGLAKVVVRKSAFTDAGNMTMVRFDHTATLLPSGDVLLVGGGTFTNGNYAETTSAELFDHASRTFRLTGEMKTARRWHTATLLPNGKVLVAGGGVDGGWDYYPMDSAELYDPTTGQFAAIGNMQVARLWHTATLLANGKVLIAGGYRPDQLFATAELYDPATKTFAPTGSMSQERAQHTATLLRDGRVLVIGGCWRCSEEQRSAEIYDPLTGRFADAGSFWRIEHTATLLDDGRVFTAGGYSYDDITQYMYHNDAQFFSVESGESNLAAKMSDYRFGHTATKLLDGQVLIIGGWNQKSPLDTADLFDVTTESFLQTEAMAKPREGHTATLLLDGRVLVTGGISSSDWQGVKSAEVYTREP